jgi:hypothetical protein
VAERAAPPAVPQTAEPAPKAVPPEKDVPEQKQDEFRTGEREIG